MKKKKSEAAHQRDKKLKTAKQNAKTEFNKWRKKLCKMVNESELSFDEKTLEYKFIINPRLTRLFYEIIVKEYIALKKASNEKEVAEIIKKEIIKATQKEEPRYANKD